MTSVIRSIPTALPKGEVLRLRDVAGSTVVVLRGCVWITQDDDARDIVLGAGESWQFERPGLTVMQAFERASVLVLDSPRMARALARPHGIALPDGAHQADAAAPVFAHIAYEARMRRQVWLTGQARAVMREARHQLAQAWGALRLAIARRRLHLPVSGPARVVQC
mgnify:CR=1 FL=1